MAVKNAAESPTRTIRTTDCLVITFLAIASLTTMPQIHADAATVPRASTITVHSSNHNDHRGGFGNGKLNQNQITINSPVFNRGIQHSDNGVINGSVNVQGAICKKKKWRNCKIIQKILNPDP